MTPRYWTDEESLRLESSIKRQQAENSEASINWTKVAEAVGTRNNKECRKRWHYVSSPDMCKGLWALDEDDRLRQAVEAQGTRWGEVSRLVRTRNPDQCSKRYYEVLKPNISKDRWSLLEDRILQDAIRAHGKSWTEIADRYFPERTPLRIRNRYHQLEKKCQEEIVRELDAASIASLSGLHSATHLGAHVGNSEFCLASGAVPRPSDSQLPQPDQHPVSTAVSGGQIVERPQMYANPTAAPSYHYC